MALPSTLHKFELQLSDVDRGVYETLSFRIAKHPSETSEYALVRVLAYALEYSPELEFGPGLCNADEPALSTSSATGRLELWIDIGGPSAERLHKASKQAESVVVYTHRDAELLRKDWSGKRIHRAEQIRVVEVDRRVLQDLAAELGRNNDWTVLRNDGVVYVTVDGVSREMPLVVGGI